MPDYRFKKEQVQGLQWTGDNVADMQSFLGYALTFTESNQLILPDGEYADVTNWIVIGQYRNIYAMENDVFFTNLMSEDPQAEVLLP